MIQKWFKTKGYKRVFKYWKPISQRSVTKFGITTRDIVVKVDDDATIKTTVVETIDGKVKTQNVETKPITYTGGMEETEEEDAAKMV
jgi:hypothetical protein